MKRRASIISTRAEIELSTNFDFPPIPCRSMDWSAIDANTFDADYDYEGGRYVSTSEQGHGSTETEAIADLFEQLGDAE